MPLALVENKFDVEFYKIVFTICVNNDIKYLCILGGKINRVIWEE